MSGWKNLKLIYGVVALMGLDPKGEMGVIEGLGLIKTI